MGHALPRMLGINHHLIPVNAPHYSAHSYHRNGAMRVGGNHGSTLGYEPNSSGEWQEQADFSEPTLALNGAADHWNHRKDTDYYSQPSALFKLMTRPQQQLLFENTARSIGGAPRDIQIRHIGNYLKADPTYGPGIAQALCISLSEVPK